MHRELSPMRTGGDEHGPLRSITGILGVGRLTGLGPG